MPAMNKDTPKIEAEEDVTQRRIRSYVLRQGRLTKGQEKALAELWPTFGIDYSPQALDLPKTFGRQDSLKILEIGFGMGRRQRRLPNLCRNEIFWVWRCIRLA